GRLTVPVIATPPPPTCAPDAGWSSSRSPRSGARPRRALRTLRAGSRCAAVGLLSSCVPGTFQVLGESLVIPGAVPNRRRRASALWDTHARGGSLGFAPSEGGAIPPPRLDQGADFAAFRQSLSAVGTCMGRSGGESLFVASLGLRSPG